MSISTFLAAFLAAALAAGGGDTDGDGIADQHEAVLGTDPARAEQFRCVVDDGVEAEKRRKQASYDATKDFTTVEFCHVGDDRTVWRVTFAEKPRPSDTVLHLYVDADANTDTGRKGSPRASYLGTEYMLTIAGGRAYSSHFSPDGRQTAGPGVSYVVSGKTVLLSADIKLSRDGRGIRYGLYVLCHTTTRPGQSVRMSDSSRKEVLEGLPVSNRRKIMRPRDYTENFGVAATFGLDILRGVLRAEETIVVAHDKLGMDGFAVDHFTSRRWPHVKIERPDGRVWTNAPKAGMYHVGFMMYDDRYAERVVVRIDGKRCGVAVANRDNNRTWLYWLTQPRRFEGGERVELVGAGDRGKHGICNIVFLAKAPAVRKVRHEVAHTTAVADVDRPGRVVVSWTTSWPCATRFEYGTSGRYGKTVDGGRRCLVHRVVLEGLDDKREYHGRGIGEARGGARYFGGDVVFRGGASNHAKPQAATASVTLTVRNEHAFAIEGWPITTGVPIPRGVLGDAGRVRLVRGGVEVPAGVRVTGRWADGSVKWLLLTFMASAPARGASEVQVQFGRDVRRAGVGGVLARPDGGGVAVDTGRLRFRITPRGELADIRPGGGRLPPGGGAGGDAKITIEEAGPIRAVVKVVSHVCDAKGTKQLRIEKRVEAYRGAAFIRVHHTFIVVGPGTFTDIRQLSFRVPVPVGGKPWTVPLVDGKTVAVTAVRQRFDNELVTVAGKRETPVRGRIVGSILSPGRDGFSVAVAVRELWQNYPMGFRLGPDGLYVELCPALRPGLYDKFPFEKEGHHLYYYLLGGRYRLKQGVAKTHELLVCFEPPGRRERVCAAFHRPPLAMASPKWMCESKAFYDVAPRDPVRFKLYEAAIDRNLGRYAARRERQRDFGMLNYGDWYGERGTNWGNVEYDTQHAFFLEYIRSGNPAAFFLGRATELHNRDVDTVQWHADADRIGGVYIHQMCHVGDYYKKGVPGSLGFPRGGYSVSHAWVEGHFDHYFLTGDRRSYETGRAIADYFTRKELSRPYDFSTTRVPGWHLIMTAAAYAATCDPYYLNAMRVVVDRVLETQEDGGWPRMMVPGHCRCTPRHRGNAGFMVAVLLSGLKYYHDVTGDERVKACIIRGAHYLLDETYSDETKGFRYTSCPKTPYRRGASPLMVEGIARAYLWTKDARFRRVLTEAVPMAAGGSSYGKGFSMYYRTAPRVLADLAAANITLDKPAGK